MNVDIEGVTVRQARAVRGQHRHRVTRRAVVTGVCETRQGRIDISFAATDRDAGCSIATQSCSAAGRDIQYTARHRQFRAGQIAVRIRHTDATDRCLSLFLYRCGRRRYRVHWRVFHRITIRRTALRRTRISTGASRTTRRGIRIRRVTPAANLRFVHQGAAGIGINIDRKGKDTRIVGGRWDRHTGIARTGDHITRSCTAPVILVCTT